MPSVDRNDSWAISMTWQVAWLTVWRMTGGFGNSPAFRPSFRHQPGNHFMKGSSSWSLPPTSELRDFQCPARSTRSTAGHVRPACPCHARPAPSTAAAPAAVATVSVAPAPGEGTGAGAGGRPAHLLRPRSHEANGPASATDPDARITMLEGQVAALMVRLDTIAVASRRRSPNLYKAFRPRRARSQLRATQRRAQHFGEPERLHCAD
jgi:hypothetical protein